MRAIDRIRVSERIGVSLLTVAPIGFVIFLIAAQYPAWWKWVIFESTPMTWLQSILLYTIAVLAAGCMQICFLKNENSQGIRWMLLGFGFLFLCLDERFALHERIRDYLLAPLQLKLPWTAAGDVILLFLLVAGICLLPQLFRLFKGRKFAFRLFIAGILMSASALIIDSFDVHHLSIEYQRFEQFLEELIETSGMLFWVNAFFLRLTQYIREWIFH